MMLTNERLQNFKLTVNLKSLFVVGTEFKYDKLNATVGICKQTIVFPLLLTWIFKSSVL
jgi:hypothetical protein